MLIDVANDVSLEDARKLATIFNSAPQARSPPDLENQAREFQVSKSFACYWRWTPTPATIHYRRVGGPPPFHDSKIWFTGFTAVNQHRYEWSPDNDLRMFESPSSVGGFDGKFPEKEQPYVDLLLGAYKKCLNVLKPKFGLADHYGERVSPHRDMQTDLRQFAWGVSIYGPELAKKLGKDRILASPAFKVEELPYGGWWVQAAENPFLQYDTAVTNRIAEHLKLQTLFG